MLVMGWCLVRRMGNSLGMVQALVFSQAKCHFCLGKLCAYYLSSCLGAACGIKYGAYNSKKYVDIYKTIFLVRSKYFLLWEFSLCLCIACVSQPKLSHLHLCWIIFYFGFYTAKQLSTFLIVLLHQILCENLFISLAQHSVIWCSVIMPFFTLQSVLVPWLIYLVR